MWYVKAKSVEKGPPWGSSCAEGREGWLASGHLLFWDREGLARVRPVVSVAPGLGSESQCGGLSPGRPAHYLSYEWFTFKYWRCWLMQEAVDLTLGGGRLQREKLKEERTSRCLLWVKLCFSQSIG